MTPRARKQPSQSVGAGTATVQERTSKLEEAKRINAEIRLVVACGKKDQARLAYHLRHVARSELHCALEYDTVGEFAVGEGHVRSERVAYDLIRLVDQLDKLPEIRSAFCAGQLFRTNAQIAVAHATVETQLEWIEAARVLTTHALREKVREDKTKLPPRKRRTFQFDPEDDEVVQAQITRVQEEARREGKKLTAGQALAKICRAMAGGTSVVPVATVERPSSDDDRAPRKLDDPTAQEAAEPHPATIASKLEPKGQVEAPSELAGGVVRAGQVRARELDGGEPRGCDAERRPSANEDPTREAAVAPAIADASLVDTVPRAAPTATQAKSGDAVAAALASPALEELEDPGAALAG